MAYLSGRYQTWRFLFVDFSIFLSRTSSLSLSRQVCDVQVSVWSRGVTGWVTGTSAPSRHSAQTLRLCAIIEQCRVLRNIFTLRQYLIDWYVCLKLQAHNIIAHTAAHHTNLCQAHHVLPLCLFIWEWAAHARCLQDDEVTELTGKWLEKKRFGEDRNRACEYRRIIYFMPDHQH